ncbi:DNA polymerase III subunit gamma/tau [Sphingomonas turrisvirgatae]|uniref:DNA polymerase III subunit gamma/tau n=1 Tax=Sphingomonas turrisvirgatae TaxID=1888892 RepID=A0A1E3LUG0_9SPHN|nr:DNA polymerase III subunit gamma/tau [Sphingomonas turrisvirgatae]ODP37373.1 DNA polymerase III subunit gamma/tau [Sphingomonas turrisvirgatae]
MSDSPLGLDEPPQPRDPNASGVYRVLARKYRPQTFAQLIGQDAMVQTLGNAIRRDRLAHAFLLTGVRGVGKTSTARLIAKALNCIGPGGQGGPTIDPCGVCEPCVAIAEGRHVDVIEIDAASHNGIDDVRQMTDAVRYAAVSARYKMYIIDEVHMMTKPAFNALLKTLEEPPAHVKFLLATTEVDKIPVTVLSRCQRFDLRRIPAEKLAAHFGDVVTKEGAQAEPEALAMIARAAEGSARDGLSILDQAIAHASLEGGAVTGEAVRAMLGLSDRNATRSLFDRIIAADAPAALSLLRDQYDLGVDPQAMLKSLLETVHRVTLAKLGNEAIPGQAAEETAALADWAGKLGFPALHRLWQLLLKGHDEVAKAALPIEACEMALLRVIHASSMPDPGELARKIAEGLPIGSAAPAAPSAPAEPAAPRDFAQLLERLEAAHEHHIAARARNLVRLISFNEPVVEVSSHGLPGDLPRDFEQAIRRVLGKRWSLKVTDAPGEATLAEVKAVEAAAEREAVLNSPVVAAAFEAFPDAELIGWTNETRRTA